MEIKVKQLYICFRSCAIFSSIIQPVVIPLWFIYVIVPMWPLLLVIGCVALVGAGILYYVCKKCKKRKRDIKQTSGFMQGNIITIGVLYVVE